MTWLDDFAKHARGQVDEEIVEALNVRGVSDAQIDTFCVGYVNGTLPAVDIPDDFRRFSQNGAKLSNMYCFPLTNPLGEIRGFQFRPVDRTFRGFQDYVLDSGEPVHFGLGQAMPHIWASQMALPVEGPFDLFPIQRCIPQSFAITGAHISEALARTLIRVCTRIVMGLDNDKTGRKEVAAFIKTYGARIRIDDLKYPKIRTPSGKESKDPGDLWEAWGDKRLCTFVQKHVRMEMTHG